MNKIKERELYESITTFPVYLRPSFYVQNFEYQNGIISKIENKTVCDNLKEAIESSFVLPANTILYGTCSFIHWKFYKTTRNDDLWVWLLTNASIKENSFSVCIEDIAFPLVTLNPLERKEKILELMQSLNGTTIFNGDNSAIFFSMAHVLEAKNGIELGIKYQGLTEELGEMYRSIQIINGKEDCFINSKNFDLFVKYFNVEEI